MLDRIFIGADGLRAGWSILLFLIFFYLSLTLTRRAASFVLPPLGHFAPSAPIPWQISWLQEGEGLFSALLATWLMGRIERRPASTYGYRTPHALRYLCAGLASGLALLSLLVLALHASGRLVFDARLLFGASVLRYAAIWLAAFLLVALFEESLSRGYLQFTLTRGLNAIYTLFAPAHANALGFWTAALALSFFFGYGHRANPGESPLGLLSAGLAGFLFCFSLWRTGSLWWAIGFHAAWDWAESFLYGVPDSGIIVQGRLFATHPIGPPWLSGGLTGPEGSILLLPVMAAGVIVILLTIPRTHAGYKPANTTPPGLH